MSKVCCRLAGGLGNQIFQYGASLLISKKSNVKYIELDDSELNNYKASRSNELPHYFKMTNSNVGNKFLLKFRLPRINILANLTDRFVGDLNFNRVLYQSLTNKSYYLDGYFQNCLDQTLFDEMLELLKKDYLYSHLSIKPNVCAIHIRGGDFLTKKYSGIASTNYYLEQLNKIKEMNSVDQFVIVTDDKNYATEIAKKISIKYFFSDGNMLDDFLLLAQSQFKVLSNSTFAIWASALGYKPGCIVLAPQKLNIHDTRNFILPGELI